MEEDRKSARVFVARPSPEEGGASAPWVAALAGFLLGSLAGILVGSPEIYGSDATLLGFFGGGLAGAIAAGSMARWLASRVGSKTSAIGGAIAGFLIGAVAGLVSGPAGTAFRSAVVNGTAPFSDVPPAVYSAVATAAAGTCLLDVLWFAIPRAERAMWPGRRLSLLGALDGALLGSLGGSLTAVFVQLAAGNNSMADISAAGRALFGSWVGALTGAGVAGSAVLARRNR